MKTLITGCSGLVGSALVEHLFNRGHSIQCLKRNRQQNGSQLWATGDLAMKPGTGFDAVIHLAGENVATGRWSKKKKDAIYSSRIHGTRDLVEYISLLPQKPAVFLCASAVGYYGSCGDRILDEQSPLGTGFLAEVCRDWEREANQLAELGIRVINLRFGMVLSPMGGALHKMIPPFRMRLGGVIGDGNQHVSWVSIRDLVHIVEFLLKNDKIRGPVNVVSPIPTTNRELTKTLGKCLGVPTFFKVPAFAAKTVFGQMADEMLLASTRATPTVLMENEYQFLDQSLEAVIRSCLAPSSP